jgi:hypothetical protein
MRRFICLALALSLSLGLAGCGAGSVAGPTSPSVPNVPIAPVVPADIRPVAAVADYDVAGDYPDYLFTYRWTLTVRNYGGSAGQFRVLVESWPSNVVNPVPATEYTSPTHLGAGASIVLDGQKYMGYQRLWKFVLVVQTWNGSQWQESGRVTAKP